MKINTHPLSQSCSLGTLLRRSNRCGTFVNLILIYVIVTASVAYCQSVVQVSRYQLVLKFAFASLPRKVGFLKLPNPCKYMKIWSGRWDSNPRRPAWEYERRL
jgi:hypothetical protein